MSEARGRRRNPRHSRRYGTSTHAHVCCALHNSEHGRFIARTTPTHSAHATHRSTGSRLTASQAMPQCCTVRTFDSASAVGYIARFCCCGHTMDSSQAPADRKRYPHTTPRPPTSRAQLSGRRLSLGLAHFIFAAALSIIARFISSSSCTSSFIRRADRNTTEPPWPICAGAEPPLG